MRQCSTGPPAGRRSADRRDSRRAAARSGGPAVHAGRHGPGDRAIADGPRDESLVDLRSTLQLHHRDAALDGADVLAQVAADAVVAVDRQVRRAVRAARDVSPGGRRRCRPRSRGCSGCSAPRRSGQGAGTTGRARPSRQASAAPSRPAPMGCAGLSTARYVDRPSTRSSTIRKPRCMTVVPTWTVVAPTSMNSTASCQSATPPMPETGMPTSGSAASADAM